jgi:2,3-diketo-5-methylthio-1-phosphopentane phosphatase
MEAGKLESVISDIILKFAHKEENPSQRRSKIKLSIKEEGEAVFNEKTQKLIKDIFNTEFKLINFQENILVPKINPKRVKESKSHFFHVESKSQIHKFLFSTWIKMITGIIPDEVETEDKLIEEFMEEVGANYRFPISSIINLSTLNMVKTVSKCIRFIAEGKIFSVENLESSAIALLLSYNTPHAKKYIKIPKVKGKYLWRIYQEKIIDERKREVIKIFCDFDGTITKKDVSIALLDRFTEGSWKQLPKNVVKGNIGSKGAYLLIKDKIKGEISEMQKYVSEFEIEDGFLEFFNFVSGRYSFEIVSDGFSFYIKEILKKWGIEAKFWASELIKENSGFNFIFPNQSDFCDLCATCKLKIIRNNSENFTVFIGNGISDRCIVEEADIVFAKSRLKQICQMKGIAFFQFENFNEILEIFKKEVKGFVIDFDGTIGWSFEGIYDAFLYTLKKFNTPLPENIRDYIGLPLIKCFEIILGEENANKAVEIFRKRYKKVFLKKTLLAPGTEKTLRKLKNLGYKIAILSNKKGEILRELINHLGISELLDIVVGEGDISYEGKEIFKPDSKTIDYISEKINVPPEKIVVVGDSEIDLQTAKNSSTLFILLYNSDTNIDKFKDANGFISSITQLQKIGEFFRIKNQIGKIHET